MDNIEKIDLGKVSWRSSEDFFESLGEALDKLDDKDESYDFTWVGKRKAIIEAGAPVNKTLRPHVKNSKNWDSTENLFIEGDNLDALKLLQESYLGKVKMIYIDPPYNTGKDFVYSDNFRASVDSYDEDTGYKDIEGHIQFKKNDVSNGRYHSDWLSMIYPRLKLCRNLLTSDGMIFVSIDDNEVHNLRKVMDEVFGADNFIDSLIWKKRYGGGAKEKYFVTLHEYILVYARDLSNLGEITVPLTEESIKRYYTLRDDNFETRGPFRTHPLEATKSMGDRPNLIFPILAPDGTEILPQRQWLWSRDTVKDALEHGELHFSKTNEKWSVGSKQYLRDRQGLIRAGKMQSVIDDVFSQHGTNEIINLFGNAQAFSFPKPTSLIKKLVLSAAAKDSIILDCFAGSASTADAIMQLNAEDGGNRKWIMAQLPEATDENSEAYKSGYKTIPDIARERIRRAGDKIAAEHPDAKVDYGFRSLVVAETNYKEVYKPAGELQQSALLDVVDNIKEDRSELDLLFGVLTASALELNRPLETRDIAGTSVYLYDYFSEVSGLVSCFAESISEDTIKQIAALKPLTAVFRDSSFPDSQAKVNLAEHFRIISPETKVKVI